VFDTSIFPAAYAMNPLTIDLPSHVPANEARRRLGIALYEADRISLDEAAELAGESKQAFMERLPKERHSASNVASEGPSRDEETHDARALLRDSVTRYDRPTEPIAPEEWAALQ
jgi:hypothetical protein